MAGYTIGRQPVTCQVGYDDDGDMSEHRGEVRDGFKFRGGSVPLDFAATLAGRLRPEPRELLARPADFSRWLVAAGLSVTEGRELSRADRDALKPWLGGRDNYLTALLGIDLYE
jgi:hypothetical protein